MILFFIFVRKMKTNADLETLWDGGLLVRNQALKGKSSMILLGKIPEFGYLNYGIFVK